MAFVTCPDTRTSYIRSGDTRVETCGGRGDEQAEAASPSATARAAPIVRTTGCFMDGWQYGLTVDPLAAPRSVHRFSATEGPRRVRPVDSVRTELRIQARVLDIRSDSVEPRLSVPSPAAESRAAPAASREAQAAPVSVRPPCAGGA